MTTIDLHGLHKELLLVNGKKSREILCTVKRGKVQVQDATGKKCLLFFCFTQQHLELEAWLTLLAMFVESVEGS